jgi:hypothetical protein
MLNDMRIIPAALRIPAALFIVAVMTLAAPIHAAHSHGDDAGHLHAPCALCKSPSPVLRPLAAPCVGVTLQPVGVLASDTATSPVSAHQRFIPSRAPPLCFA